MLFKVNPDKLIKSRGERTRRDISEASSGAITQMDLSYWERGKWQPSEKKLPILLKVLGVQLDDIADSVDLSLRV